MLFKFAAGCAAVALIALPVAAHAHARLMSAVPAVDSAAAPPAEIRIVFDEEVTPKFSGIVLTDAAGKVVPTGKTALDPKDKKVMIVPVKKRLAPGPYLVTWHAVSEDTHRIVDKYRFTVK